MFVCLDKNIVTLEHIRHCSKPGNSDNSEINNSPLVRDTFVTESFVVRGRKTVYLSQFDHYESERQSWL